MIEAGLVLNFEGGQGQVVTDGFARYERLVIIDSLDLVGTIGSVGRISIYLADKLNQSDGAIHLFILCLTDASRILIACGEGARHEVVWAFEALTVLDGNGPLNLHEFFATSDTTEALAEDLIHILCGKHGYWETRLTMADAPIIVIPV